MTDQEVGMLDELDSPLKGIFDQLEDSLFAHAADGCCIYANPAAERVFGPAVNEMRGKMPPYPSWPQEYADTYLRQFRLLLASPSSLGPWRLPIIMLNASGQRVSVEMTHARIDSPDDRQAVHYLLARLPKLDDRGSRLRELFATLAEYEGELLQLVKPGSAQPPTETADELPSAVETQLETLSPRERDVLRVFLEGADVPAVAGNLNISQHTVRNHLKSIFRKLGVHSQRELLLNLQSALKRK